MRVILLDAPEDLIRARRRMEVDQFDEMWEGELHMLPLPGWDHQSRVGDLIVFFSLHWQDLCDGDFRSHVVVTPPGTPDMDVAGERIPRSYRVPDLVFLLKGHEERVQHDWVVGPPDAVIEVCSPGDETYKKFPFYHSLGVTEVVVMHRDTKAVEVYAHGMEEYARIPSNPDGSVTSRILDTIFRTEAAQDGSITLHLWRGKFPNRRGTV